MNFIIILYAKHDRDLISLSSKYKISLLFRMALLVYAYGQPIKFNTSIIEDFDDKNVRAKSVHMHIDDPKVINLLNSIKKNSRIPFCKMLLRNCLIHQNLSIYFNDCSLDSFAHDLDLTKYGDNFIVNCDEFAMKAKRQLTIDDIFSMTSLGTLSKVDSKLKNPFNKAPAQNMKKDPTVGTETQQTSQKIQPLNTDNIDKMDDTIDKTQSSNPWLGLAEVTMPGMIEEAVSSDIIEQVSSDLDSDDDVGLQLFNLIADY